VGEGGLEGPGATNALNPGIQMTGKEKSRPKVRQYQVRTITHKSTEFEHSVCAWRKSGMKRATSGRIACSGLNNAVASFLEVMSMRVVALVLHMLGNSLLTLLLPLVLALAGFV